MSTKNKPRGRPPVDSELLRFRVDRPVIDALDRFTLDSAANEDAPLERPEAIRRILRDWLIGHGYLKTD